MVKPETNHNGQITERTKISIKMVTWLIGIILTAASGLSGAVIAGVMKDSQIGERLQMLEMKIGHVSEMVQARLEAVEAQGHREVAETSERMSKHVLEIRDWVNDRLQRDWERFHWFLALTAEMNNLKLPEEVARGLGNPPAAAEKGGGT